MSRTNTVLSPEQVKQNLRLQGVTITAWAAARGYTRVEVYRVLNGQYKGRFGKAHDIAVELGMKPQPTAGTTGPAQHKATTACALRNPQTEVVA
jgi:gp16 family phage-associated protein